MADPSGRSCGLVAWQLKKMQIRIEFFYSKACPHCTPVRKMLYEIAKDMEGIVEIEEIDAWSEKGQPLAEKYGIQLVPTIVVNGVKRAEGILSREQLISAMREALS